jgi:hypothetical protein
MTTFAEQIVVMELISTGVFFHHPSAGAYGGSDCMKTTLSDSCLIVHLASTPQNAHAT